MPIVYGVALDGIRQEHREYLWDAQIMAALYQYEPIAQPTILQPDSGEAIFDRFRTGVPPTDGGHSTRIRVARDSKERQIYLIPQGQHWRIILVDSKLKTVHMFDPMGSSFTKLERQATRQTFQDHSQDDLHIKTQSDEVNCGIWVIWIGWLWLSPEAKATNNFKSLVERTMHTEHHIHNLLHNDTPAKSRMNLAYALKIRRTLRLSLNPNLPEADATHHSTLRDRVVDTYYREPAI
jgi:hypothetical protein